MSVFLAKKVAFFKKKSCIAGANFKIEYVN